MEKLRYNKIDDFIKDLNIREQKYIIKKLKDNILKSEINIVKFTINGKNVNS